MEKFADVEKSIAGKLDDVLDGAFKSQLKSTDQAMKTSGKKFKGKCHKCGKIGHMKRDCRSKSEKGASTKGTRESKNGGN